MVRKKVWKELNILIKKYYYRLILGVRLVRVSWML